jgi:predicted small lipoprotein YifL
MPRLIIGEECMRYAITSLLALLLLSACGQTGPLYLPGQPPPSQQGGSTETAPATITPGTRE